MTLTARVVRATGSAHPLRSRAEVTARSSGSSRVLGEVSRRNVNLAIWTRSLGEDVVAAAHAHASASDAHVTGRLARRRDAIQGLDDLLTGVPAGPFRRALTRDVERLARTLMRIGGVDELRFAFGVVTTDQCRRFHEDYVRLRLITTYAGPATEWVPEPEVDRSGHSTDHDARLSSHSGARFDERSVRRAAAGHVLLLKGNQHEHGGPGGIHRSPPIERSGQRRVLLTLTAGARRELVEVLANPCEPSLGRTRSRGELRTKSAPAAPTVAPQAAAS